MQKVGCALIQDVRGTRQSLPTGFTRRDPALASYLTLIKLRDFSRPENRADSDEVGSDLKIILALEGDLVKRNSFSQSSLFRRRQVGRARFSPLMAFDEAFGEWEARTGDCRPPTLVPPERGLTDHASDAQAITKWRSMEPGIDLGIENEISRTHSRHGTGCAPGRNGF